MADQKKKCTFTGLQIETSRPTSNCSSDQSLDCCDMSPLTPTSQHYNNQLKRRSADVYIASDGGHTFNVAERRKPSRSEIENSWQWKLAFMVGFTVFSAAVLIGISFFMDSVKCHNERKQSIIETFNGFFMTPVEANSFAEKMKRGQVPVAPYKNLPNFPGYNPALVESTRNRSRSAAVYDTVSPASTSGSAAVYHGCCETTQSYETFDELQNLAGQLVTVVQFDSKKQYFFMDNCVHTTQCSMPCTCMQRFRFVVAVVEDDEGKPKLEWVRYLGTCKCINTDVD